jgi:hypothetical protein
MRRAISSLLLLLLVSCAATARITGDFGDYRSYRRIRLATTTEDRLAASDSYLHEFPGGDYRAEVRAWFKPAEEHYLKLAWNNPARLRSYLDAMPRGPHAAAVTERIAELESRRMFSDRREQEARQHAADIERRLAAAADQRREFLRNFARLARSMAGIRSFGQTPSKLSAELLPISSDGKSTERCDNNPCARVFSFPYAVPDRKEVADRVALVSLQITSQKGLLTEVTLSGADLLTRVAEAVEVNAVSPAEALAHAVDVLDDALSDPLPKARCMVQAVSPAVLSRRCDGVVLDVLYGLEAGASDVLRMTAEKASSAPGRSRAGVPVVQPSGVQHPSNPVHPAP